MNLTPYTDNLTGSQPLTTVHGTWPANTTFTYAWRHSGSNTVLATSDAYTPVWSDKRKRLTVTVVASLPGYTDAVLTSAATERVAFVLAVYPNVTAPTINDEAVAGQELRAESVEWASGATITYAWKRSGTTVVGTKEKYTPVAADIGKTLEVTVTATRQGFATLTITSEPTDPVLGAPFTTAPTPTITGTTTTGSTLTAVPGNWNPSSRVVFTYVWNRAETSGGTPAPIAKATGKTYKLVAADKGKWVSVTVTASFAGYATTSRTSAATLMAN